LADVLAWPAGSEWFSARVLVVPRRLHRELRYSGRLPMFQMIAKNVGIRRALGEFIIATNVDIVFSDELFQWLKTGNPESGRLYRSDRWDIPNEIQLEPDLDVLLLRARQEAIRRNLRDGTYLKRECYFVTSAPPQFETAFYEPLTHELRQLEYLLSQGKTDLAEVGAELRNLFSKIEDLRENYYLPILHTNGCGDFTMLSRADWFALRGYPEWHIFSWAIDSAIVFQAHYNGIEIHELPPTLVHYHIEHDYGSGWTPEGSSDLWARMDQNGIPYISYRLFTEIAKELGRGAREGRFTIYNELNWGLFEREVEAWVLVENSTPARPPLRFNDGALQELLDLTPVADLPLEEASCLGAPVVRSELNRSADGVSYITVDTHPDEWSYSLVFDLSALPKDISECWCSIDLKVESGLVYASLLNQEHTDFLIQVPCPGPNTVFREVRFFVNDIRKASQIIFRNGSKGGTRARFQIRSVRILLESDAAADTGPGNHSGAPPHGGPEAPHQELLAADAPGERARGNGGAEVPLNGRPTLADLRPVSADAIVRFLPAFSRPSGEGERSQAVVILPPGRAAVLDCNSSVGCPRRLSLSMHVIEGEVGISLICRATGQVFAEHRTPAGPPLTDVALDLSAASGTWSLVLRNSVDFGHTRIVLHAIGYQMDGD